MKTPCTYPRHTPFFWPVVIVLGVILLGTLSARAEPSLHAFQIEAEIGNTTYQKSNETDFWQRGNPRLGFYDDFNLKSQSWSIGVTSYITPTIRWRAGYSNLGAVSYISRATQDENWNPITRGCNFSSCLLNTWTGTGYVDGLYITAVKEFNVEGWTPYIEGGAWFYRTHARHVIVDQNGSVAIPGEINGDTDNIGPVFGFGIGRGTVSFGITWMRSDRGGTPAFYQGYTTKTAFRVRF